MDNDRQIVGKRTKTQRLVYNVVSVARLFDLKAVLDRRISKKTCTNREQKLVQKLQTHFLQSNPSNS